MRILLVLTSIVFCSSWAHASRQFQANDSLLGAAAQLPASGTVSFLVNPQFTLGDGNIHVLFEVKRLDSVSYFQVVAGPTARLYTSWGNQGVFTEAIANSPAFPVGTWSNVVVTWTAGGSTVLYLNGVQIATCATAWTDTTTFPWSFGGRADGTFDSRSKVGMYGIWNRVLSTGEIAALNTRQPPSAIPSGLFAEYNLTGASLAAQAGPVGTLVATGTTVADDPPPPPSPTLSLAGPSKGTPGVPLYFSVGETNLKNTTAITLSDGGAGGSWSSTHTTLASANPFATAVYTPVASGNIAISLTNDQGLTNPAPLALQVVTLEPSPTLTADSTAKSVNQGNDVSYSITQTIPAGYTGETPLLRLFNIPPGFSLTINGVDCGSSKSAIAYFNWRNCGSVPAGTYTLTIHTIGLAKGQYSFSAIDSERQFSNGAGVTLSLTVN